MPINFDHTPTGVLTLLAPASGNWTLQLPAADGSANTPLMTNGAGVLSFGSITGSGSFVKDTSPTIVTPTIASFLNATHTHQNAAGGGTLDASAIAAGTMAAARLGSGSASSSTVLLGDSSWAQISNAQIATSAAIALSKLAVDPLARANHTGTQAESTITNLVTDLAAKEATANKGVAGGYASLDGSGKVPTSQLPATGGGGLAYLGLWNANTNSPSLSSGSSTTAGQFYKVSVAGTTALDGISDWAVGDWVISDGSAWEKIDNTDLVSSVFGRTGAITATNGDYTASNITNVAAGNISSTDVQAALNQLDSIKQATITGGATTIVSSNLTVSRALVSDGSGKVAVATTTATEIGYVNGVTSAIQTQLNAKVDNSHVYAFSDLSGSVAASQMPALTGDVTTTAGTVATTIAAHAVTVGKLAQAGAYSVLGNNTSGTADITAVAASAAGFAVLTAANAGAQRTALGLAIGTDVQAYSASTTLLGNTTTGTGSTIVLAGSPTITTPTIASFTNATHNHQNAAGGGTLDAAAIGSGTIATARLPQDLTTTGAPVFGSLAVGTSNTVSGTAAMAQGQNNTADALYSLAGGGYATTRSIIGAVTRASGKFATLGDAQVGNYIFRRQSTSGTGVVLTSDAASPSTNNQLILPNNSSFAFTITIAGHRTDAADRAMYRFTGLLTRDASAGTTTLQNYTKETFYESDATWDVALTADTTNGGLTITCTGAAAKTISWVARAQTVEVTN